MEEGREREREDEVGEEKRGTERKHTEEKREKQHRLMTSLWKKMRRHDSVCCSHSTKWKEFGRCTEATAG